MLHKNTSGGEESYINFDLLTDIQIYLALLNYIYYKRGRRGEGRKEIG